MSVLAGVPRSLAISSSSPHRRQFWLLAILLWLTGGAHAAALSTIDPDAHYPEGPVWRDGQLFYVEYSAGNIRRWDGTRATTIWHRDGCGPSGLIDFHGGWLVACYDDNSIVEIDANGKQVRVLRTDSLGRSFRGPNDFAADGRGGIYFSASGVYDIKAPISGAVLHMAADGKVITEVANTLHYPNGLTLAQDRRHLLVAEMLAGRILSFAIDANGRLGPRSVWARLRDLAPATPDGGRIQWSGRPEARTRWQLLHCPEWFRPCTGRGRGQEARSHHRRSHAFRHESGFRGDGDGNRLRHRGVRRVASALRGPRISLATLSSG